RVPPSPPCASPPDRGISMAAPRDAGKPPGRSRVERARALAPVRRPDRILRIREAARTASCRGRRCTAMAEEAGERTIYLVGHAHIDLGYRWKWNETVHRVARDTFRGVLRMMDEYPELTFVQSQLAIYEAMAQFYPDIYRQIK